MAEQFITKKDEVKGLLRKLFRSDQADLDFGIYRIMNFKRKEVERFIDHDLIDYAEVEFRDYSRVSTADLERELEEDRKRIESLIGPGIFNASGEPVKYLDVKAVQEYEEKKKALRAAALTEEQVNDVFSHVYEFFSRYYEDGDFIPKTRYGGRDKYYIPYNGEEVALHWATKDMYYVKTGEYFKKYSFKAGRFTVTFRLVEAKVETGDVNGEKKVFVLADEDPVHLDEENSSVEIRFNYRELSEEEKKRRVTRKVQSALVHEALERIRYSLESSSIVGILQPKTGENLSILEKHLNAYVDRNTKDFFIHKDLKEFLERELDFYLKNEVWSLDELDSLSQGGTKTAAAKVKAIRNIAKKVIEFLSQIESFQKKLFEKKKFVLRTDYCITLDLIPPEFYEEIGKNEKQVAEWKELYKLDEITKGSFYNIENKKMLDIDFLKQYSNLVLDTKYFNEEFKWKLLSYYNDLDDNITGLIIKSENYQGLNLIYNKYINLIDLVYIDPPYNTGKDGFNYKDNYFHSSWLSMINNSLNISKDILSNKGAFLNSIGNHELHRLIFLLNNIYGEENYIGPFIWVTEGNIDNQKKYKQNHEYILLYAKNVSLIPNPTVIDPNIPKESKLFKEKIENTLIKNGPKNPISEINLPAGFPVEIEKGIINPNNVEWPKFNSSVQVENGRLVTSLVIKSGWSSRELLEEFIKNDFNPIYDNKYQKTSFILTKDGVPYIIKERSEQQGHVLTVLENMGSTQTESGLLKDMAILFTYPKPVQLLKYLISATSSNDSIIIDFFAGSGPISQSVLELNRQSGNRKYILMDFDKCFDDVLQARIKKIMFSSEWKKGIPSNKKGYSHIMKRQYLEQYEDTLNNIEFKGSDGIVQKTFDRFPDYFLSYILEYETRDSLTRLSTENFKTPFNYRVKILSTGEEREEPVDLVETFNYLLGLQVKKMRAQRDEDRLYRTVFGERNHEQVAVIWRDTPGLDLERDKRFIESTILAGSTPDTIFVNGDSYVRNAKPIEPEFRRLMGA